jgi:hypothetical protein
MKKSKLLIASAAAATALMGCATLTGSSTQSVSVETVERSGHRIMGAECRLNNDKGIWTVKAPTHVQVGRSGEDLSVHCTAEGHEPGLVKVISRANGGMVGNVVFGGVVGALVDNSGAGYDYPAVIRVVMGASLVLDKRDEDPNAPAPAISSAPQAPAPTPVSTGGARATTMDDLKDLLPASK